MDEGSAHKIQTWGRGSHIPFDGEEKSVLKLVSGAGSSSCLAVGRQATFNPENEPVGGMAFPFGYSEKIYSSY